MSNLSDNWYNSSTIEIYWPVSAVLHGLIEEAPNEWEYFDLRVKHRSVVGIYPKCLKFINHSVLAEIANGIAWVRTVLDTDFFILFWIP